MELLYLWINKTKNNVFYHQQINFSPTYIIEVDCLDNPSKIILRKSNNFNLFKTEKIDNISVLIGSNGSGKTTLMSYIAHNDLLKPRDHGSDYERMQKEENELSKAINVYYNKKENCIWIYYNLEVPLEVENNTDVIFHDMHYTGEENSARPLFELHDQSVVYITNSNYIDNSFIGFSSDFRLRNYNLHPQIVEQISKQFYTSLYEKDPLYHSTNLLEETAREKIKKRNQNKFQQILDVVYFKFLIDSKNSIIDKIGILCNKMYVRFDYLPYLLYDYNHETNNLERKIQEFNKKYRIKELINQNIANVLYLNLLFELYCFTEDSILPDINVNNFNLYESIQSILEEKNIQNIWKKYTK